MKKCLIALLMLLSCSVSLAGSKQLLVVATSKQQSVQGQLQRYQRQSIHAHWQKVGNPIPVVVGKHGISLNVKKEGDGLTPSGIYSIGPAFGFAQTANYKISYLPLTETSICVDDAKSVYYNQLIDASKVTKKDWSSGEEMHQVPGYQIGAVVQYNSDPVVKNAGSCIFLHVWKNADTGTAGCIAMEKTNLQQVLNWLDGKKNPVIVIKVL